MKIGEGDRIALQITYNTYVAEANTQLHMASAASEGLKSHALGILMNTDSFATSSPEIQNKSINTINDAKRLIGRVKSEVNKSAPKDQRKRLNKQLDDSLKEFKKQFTESLRQCNTKITKAEQVSKALGGKSPRLARISAGVKSIFRRESLSNLTHKIAKLTTHKPLFR
jgi:oligoendopeptidase F